MSIEPGWYPVDESGHVPYVAAELPLGHEVYLDASGNIGGIRPIEMATDETATGAGSEEKPPENTAPDGQRNAPDNVAAATPAQGG